MAKKQKACHGNIMKLEGIPDVRLSDYEQFQVRSRSWLITQ